MLAINWQLALICLVFALTLMIITKIVSVGSILSAILFPILILFINTNYLVEGNKFSYLIFSLILSVLIIYNHRENIKRLFSGKENKLNFSKK